MFPKEFIARYEKIFGNDVEKFIEYCKKPIKKSIRVNTLKIGVRDCIKRLENTGMKLRKIPWTDNGFWVEEKNVLLGYTLEHYLGYYYIQEAASMVPPIVLKPKEGELILDMAAAPGSKTTQIAEIMKNKGVIVANDVSVKRIKSLRFNIEKLGIINTIVTMKDGRVFGKKYLEAFDRVLLDAPCSSEGSIRKDWGVLSKWNVRLIKKMSRLQKHLLDSAVRCAKKGGVIVYSTCTVAPEENEGVIDYVLRKYEDLDVADIKLKGLKSRPGITEWEDCEFDERVKKSLRIWPQDNDTQAFFVAKLIKGG